ncbi:MAG: DUF4845 domain-containing protein [Burkholderiaceae bacterium]
MKLGNKFKQRGVSLIGILFVGGVLVGAGAVGIQVMPTYLEYQTISSTVKKISGNSVGEIRVLFDKAAQINDIKAITGKDLDVTKDGDKFTVKFAYDKEIHLAGPAYLVIKYAGSSK